MENQIKHSDLNNIVFCVNNEVVTTSIKVADYFSKQHKDVLKRIRKIKKECSPAFAKRNFALCYENNELQNGKPQPYYQITKDGWFMLVMGFTGKKASELKEAFIDAFNYMYAQLNERAKTGMQLMNELVRRETISKAKGSFGSKLMNERKKEKRKISEDIEKAETELIPNLFDD